MPSKTYKTRVLVLKKTRLREKDLIVTMMDDAGALLQGVAKGARKPGGSLAARLELFSEADVLMARGRSLDIVCEARLAGTSASMPTLEQAACASPVAELLCLVAQRDLAQPRLFELSRATFSFIRAASPPEALAGCAAGLWKVMAQSGFRPSFAACALCGRDPGAGEGRVAVSLEDGGAVCPRCPRPAGALIMPAGTLRWCDALIGSRFQDIAALDMPPAASSDALQLAGLWVRAHTGRALKSLDFLLASGLF